MWSVTRENLEKTRKVNVNFTIDKHLYEQFKRVAQKDMRKYSNNNATAHLNSFIEFNDYKLFFSDIGLPLPDPKASDYTLTSDQCSRFLRLLYNSSVLTNKNSEFALSLLTESVYRGGLLRNFKERKNEFNYNC